MCTIMILLTNEEISYTNAVIIGILDIITGCVGFALCGLGA